LIEHAAKTDSYVENAAETDSFRAGKDDAQGGDRECWEDLDAQYYDRVFGGVDSDSDMDMGDNDM